MIEKDKSKIKKHDISAIRCPNKHKVAEVEGNYVFIKCHRCKHFIRIALKLSTNH